MTRSWVTSLPTMSILLMVAALPSRMFHRQIDDRLAVRPGPPDLLGHDLGVDVAVVAVEGLDRLGGLVPGRPVERLPHPGCRARLYLAERVEVHQLLGREPPVADDLERAHGVLLPLVHGRGGAWPCRWSSPT